MAKGAANTTTTIQFPQWFMIYVGIASLALGYIGWRVDRGLDRLENLADKLGATNASVIELRTMLNERIPQPISKELQPIYEALGKLTGTSVAPAQVKQKPESGS